MSNPKVVFEAVPSRWRVENRIHADKWVCDQCFPTLAAATIYAQKWLDNNPDIYAYRVASTADPYREMHPSQAESIARAVLGAIGSVDNG